EFVSGFAEFVSGFVTDGGGGGADGGGIISSADDNDPFEPPPGGGGLPVGGVGGSSKLMGCRIVCSGDARPPDPLFPPSVGVATVAARVCTAFDSNWCC